MGYHVVFSDVGYRVLYEEQQQRQHLQEELTRLKAEQERLTQQIVQLREDKQALEDLIHRELGYVYPDEFMMIMPKEKKKETTDHE